MRKVMSRSGVFVIAYALCWPPAQGVAQQRTDTDACRNLLLHGRYEECIDEAAAGIVGKRAGEVWPELKAEAEFRLGRYDDALQTVTAGLEKYPTSIRLRWQAMQIGPYADREDQQEVLAQQIAALVQNSPWLYTDADNLVALGQFAVSQGADAKQVQGAFFQRARRNQPLHRSPILALGNLALEKRDFALAADVFRPALETFSDDPEMLFGLARALGESDSKQAAALLDKTLEQNPRHLDAIAWQAEQLIDGEQYPQAQTRLQTALEVNPKHPDVLAYLAVIATLQSRTEEAVSLRNQALSTWKSNPRVDYLMGRKLSQKYRFEEGAAHQRIALAFNSKFLPSQKQLAQDLLRLGREAEGWKLAAETYKQDEYDVASYNLVTLRDELEKFATLDRDGFRVRMETHEAEVYGERVLRLLIEARKTLCAKYQLELPDTVLVEIFPKPADFAVRTFGMPGAGSFLGVCFGDVITANSPASQQANPTNWESVLWHEFTHVVTLNKTHNRMPRWLSEGISVYEERQRDAAWGERMNPAYRKMILDGEVKPIAELSSAFLAPPSPRHLMFAYFESSLAVEFIIQMFGQEVLLAILDDLAVGMNVNEAIERHTAPLKKLEEDFAKFVKVQTHLYGQFVDWSPAELSPLAAEPDGPERILKWAAEHPQNYLGLKACGELLIKLNRPEDALQILTQAVELFPDETGPERALAQLAALRRQREDVEGEREALQILAQIDDAAPAALLRLIDLENARKDWKNVHKYAIQLIAIRPLIPQPHAALAKASEELGDLPEAILAIESLLQLNPPDPADLHYRLAVQLDKIGDAAAAKRNVLKALEAAPRYRAALSLLLRLTEPESASPPQPPKGF